MTMSSQREEFNDLRDALFEMIEQRQYAVCQEISLALELSDMDHVRNLRAMKRQWSLLW